jgi:hypothetical protein
MNGFLRVSATPREKGLFVRFAFFVVQPIGSLLLRREKRKDLAFPSQGSPWSLRFNLSWFLPSMRLCGEIGFCLVRFFLNPFGS